MQDGNKGSSVTPDFSRREFLKGSGAAMAASAMTTAARESRAQESKANGKVVSGPVDVTLNVNGSDHTFKLEPRVTLLDVRRRR